ncbi:MAG: hypothetical protein D6713_02405 [Deltaproteobacteria bacterium]|nr:MAG: hypothetical protein D6713_02405 [Deltaproteobacteria bacterium]
MPTGMSGRPGETSGIAHDSGSPSTRLTPLPLALSSRAGSESVTATRYTNEGRFPFLASTLLLSTETSFTTSRESPIMVDMRSLREISEQAGIRTSSMMSTRHLLGRALPLLLSGAILTAAACAPLMTARVKKPKVRVVSVTIEEVRKSEPGMVPLTLRLAVENENSFTLAARKLVYTISREGEEIFSGKAEDLPSIEPGKEKIIVLPVQVAVARLIRTTSTFIRQRKISLTVRGALTVGTFLGGLTIPFEKRVEKSARDLLRSF